MHHAPGPSPSPLLALLLLAAPASAADPRRGEQWNLDLIESDAAHKLSTGAGAVVAVVDSGVQADHPDLAGRIGQGYDVVQDDATAQDGDGHGTHVSGIIAAASGNGIGVESVAPGATIMPIRVLGDDGGGATDDVARGVDYARTHGANVINLSLGSEVPLIGATGGDAFDAAVHRAIAAGIVVVAAAGNNGVPVCEQPAAGDGLLCVGAVDKRKQRSFFSSFASGLGRRARWVGRLRDRHAERGRAVDVQGLRLRGAGGHVAGGPARCRVSPRCWSRAAYAGRRRSSGFLPPRATSGRPEPTRSTAPGSSTHAPRWRGSAVARQRVARHGDAPRPAGVRAREEDAAGTRRAAARDPAAGARRPRRAGPCAGAGARARDRARLAQAPRRARGHRRRAAQSPRPPDGTRPAFSGPACGFGSRASGAIACARSACAEGRTLDRVLEPLTHRPDVLGARRRGGTLGEAWMRGLLDGAGAATGIDFRDCEYFVGTSAGSIVAAFLAAGREPDSGA